MVGTWVIENLDADFPGGYQVVVADLNHDGRSDVVGLGETVAWLENPSWRKHFITAMQTRSNIDLAPYDLDRDGDLEFAIASDFALNDSAKGGSLHWFHRTTDLDQPWVSHPIDSYPTSHRLRWANVDGSGEKVLISAPLLGRGAHGPEYDQYPAPLFLYRIPENPAADPWPRETIDETLHVTHGLEVLDFDGDGREEILTASFEGVHLFHSSGTSGHLKWDRTRLCAGEQSMRPARGSSEVRLGKLGNGRRFIATIEPWHGDQVVVYLEAKGFDELWQRLPIDSSFNEGHALEVLDVDGDGNDEIVAGFRGKRHGVVTYHAPNSAGTAWERTIIDEGGIACQGLLRADLRKDGSVGLVGIGGVTHNVRFYAFKRK